MLPTRHGFELPVFSGEVQDWAYNRTKPIDQRRPLAMRPNVRANRGTGGRTPWPGLRECTAYLRPGQGGLPEVLRLSEGLGSTVRALEGLAGLDHVQGCTIGRGDDVLAHEPSLLVAADGS